MMRKIFLSLAAAAGVAATPAFAAAEPGLYVGAGATHDNIIGSGDAEGFGVSGIGATAFAGFNLPLGSSAFAGVEANFDLASADIGDKIDGVKADHSYGASARLGLRMGDSAALYGRVGYQRARTSEYVSSVKFSESRDGLRLGGGLEASITPKIGVRVEFNHTRYHREDTDPINTGLANNQGTVGLVYGF